MRVKVITNCLALALTILFAQSLPAAHWAPPPATTTYMHLAGHLTIQGSPPQEGDEVAVFGAGGTVIGVFVHGGTTGAIYGDLAVTGDNPGTATVIEGAGAGERLTIKVWQASTAREYSGSEVTLSGYTGYGYQAATVPLVFAANAFTGVNIAVWRLPVLLDSSTYYQTIQEAYLAAGAGSVIQAQAANFSGGVTFNRDISVTLRGGYNADYSNRNGDSILCGDMIIGSGSVIVDGLVISASLIP